MRSNEFWLIMRRNLIIGKRKRISQANEGAVSILLVITLYSKGNDIERSQNKVSSRHFTSSNQCCQQLQDLSR